MAAMLLPLPALSYISYTSIEEHHREAGLFLSFVDARLYASYLVTAFGYATSPTITTNVHYSLSQQHTKKRRQHKAKRNAAMNL